MKKLKIGAVGLGRLGSLHAENLAFRIPGVELGAICSLDSDELSMAGIALGDPDPYLDYENMLREAELDAVVLTTPSGLHCQQIEQALAAGLHVFCEKPLGVTVEECERTVEVVKAHPDQIFMLGFMRRHDPSYRYAYRKIQEGYIGRPILFRSYSVDPEAAIQGVLRYMTHSAGQFLDMAVHDIDLARWMLQSEPQSIYAVGACYAHEEFAQFNDGDNVAALMQFQNQAMAFMLAGRTAPHGYNVETEVIGTKATLRIGSVPAENRVELLDGQGVRRLCSYNFVDRFGEAFLAELTEFAHCIREGRQPGIKVEDGLEATRIALAATRSFQEHELVRLNEKL
jgi:myo-inositol 2-dehydrogenase/D-chiro-inositol 1-dehydrogenase